MKRFLSPRCLRYGVALAALLAGCSENPVEPAPPLEALPRELTAPERRVIAASNGFAFHLLRDVNAGERAENVFLSPLSVSMALGMTMNGAAGSTYDEMRATLGFEGLAQEEINASYRGLLDLLVELDPGVRLGLANSVWYRQGYPFEASFFDAVQTSFDAEVEPLDFSDPASLTRINGWVEQSTSGRIDSILDRIRPDAVMYLINAIYFKGSWRERFDEEETRDAIFSGIDGEDVPVRMMSTSAAVRTGWAPGYRAVDLPYGNGAFTMTIVLPDDTLDVNDFVARLDAGAWEALVQGLGEPRESRVSMPRFRVEYEKVLNETLQALGMPTAFIPGGADFTRMSAQAGRDLSISEVKHKSFVEVNEEGTEAAAVTSVEIIETSAPAEIRIDRPFLFAIRERFSGTILFLGKITKPGE